DRRPPRPQVGDACAQPGPEAVAVVRVGGVPGLRHARRWGDVRLRRAREPTVDRGQLRGRPHPDTEAAPAAVAVHERRERCRTQSWSPCWFHGRHATGGRAWRTTSGWTRLLPRGPASHFPVIPHAL